MSISSCDTTNKDCLEEASFWMAPTEATTNYSHTDGDSFTNLDELINDAFAETDSVLDGNVVSSTSHLKDDEKYDAEKQNKL